MRLAGTIRRELRGLRPGRRTPARPPAGVSRAGVTCYRAVMAASTNPDKAPARQPDTDTALAQEIAALRAEVARLNAHRFVRDMNSPGRMLALQFARGLALGLGTVVGASILVSVSVYLLSQVDFVPILGDWAADIAREIEEGR